MVYSNHFYAGSVWSPSDPNRTSKSVSVEIRTPEALGATNEFYYVLVSLWDNVGSYDQIGFTNDGGVWGFTVSSTTYCAGTYNYNPDVKNLDPGVLYTFVMTIAAHGYINFSVFHGTTLIDGLEQYSGATQFNESYSYTCDSSTYLAYTDFEEGYYTDQLMPSFNFIFADNYHGTSPTTQFVPFENPLGGGHVTVAGTTTRLENEPFAEQVTGHPFTVKMGTGLYTRSFPLVLTEAFGTDSVNLTVKAPASFTITLGVTSGSPSFTTKLTITIPSTTASGTYNVRVTATDESGIYTYVTLQVTVK